LGVPPNFVISSIRRSSPLASSNPGFGTVDTGLPAQILACLCAVIINRLNKDINAGLADTSIKARLADLGGTVLSGSPSEFGKLIVDDTEKWAKVIRAANIKVE
jgi:hypothetical protein